MEHFSGILVLSFAMLLGCYIAGMLPLSVTLSEVCLHYCHLNSVLLSFFVILTCHTVSTMNHSLLLLNNMLCCRKFNTDRLIIWSLGGNTVVLFNICTNILIGVLKIVKKLILTSINQIILDWCLECGLSKILDKEHCLV